jgi:hypothetical protein
MRMGTAHSVVVVVAENPHSFHSEFKKKCIYMWECFSRSQLIEFFPPMLYVYVLIYEQVS